MAATDDELHPLILTKNEWDIVAEIRGLLQEFEDVTEVMCASKHPTLTGAILMYNALTDACEDFADVYTGTEAVHEAVDAAKAKLCVYYAKADAAVYPIATTIDPRVRLTYYEREEWEEEWVCKAKAAIEGAFSSYDDAAQRCAAEEGDLRKYLGKGLQASVRPTQERARGSPGRAGN